MKSQRGFTLVELVLVIVILGVISVVAIPRVDTQVFDAHAAARELVGAVRHAQHMAMTHTGAAPYQITTTGTSFEVTQNGNAIADPATGTAPFQSSWTDVTLGSAGTMVFDGRGRPSCTGFAACTVPEDNDLQITVTAGGQTRTIQIERYTGYARIL